MPEKNEISRILAVIIAFVMVVTMVMGAGAETAEAATSYYMPTRLVTYKMVKGKWKKQSEVEYKYDSKGNMTNWAGTKLDLDYKNGKLSKVTITGKDDMGSKYKNIKKYNSKGRISTLRYNSDNVLVKYDYSYNKKGYVSKIRWSDGDVYRSFKYEYRDSGLPKKITCTTYELDNTQKTIENYDKNGIPRSGKHYIDKKLDTSWSNDITRKNGKVTKVVETHKKNGKSGAKYKYEYHYGKAKTTNRKRYIELIGMTQASLTMDAIGNNPVIGYCYYNAY